MNIEFMKFIFSFRNLWFYTYFFIIFLLLDLYRLFLLFIMRNLPLLLLFFLHNNSLLAIFELNFYLFYFRFLIIILFFHCNFLLLFWFHILDLYEINQFFLFFSWSWETCQSLFYRWKISLVFLFFMTIDNQLSFHI